MKWLGWMVAVVACTVVVGSSAEAQTVTVDRCAGAKMRCAMGYTHICGVAGVEGQLKCYQTATLRGRFVDPVCINRTTDEILAQHRSAALPTLPDALSAYQPLLNKLLAKEPGQRFGSAREVLEALQQTEPPAASTSADTVTSEPVPAVAS